MEWLKDPKNQPVVAGILIGVILVVAVLAYFLFFKAPSADTSAEAPAPTPTGQPDMAPGGAPPAPGGAETPTAGPPPAPAGTPPAPSKPQPGSQVQVASASPLEAWRPDPFLPPGYRPPKTGHKPHAPIPDLPVPGPMFPWNPNKGKVQIAELAQPARRMAGLLVNSGIYAIIESNGQSEIVRPGDTLNDRLASVEKIERDKVILKTKDAKPRYIVVRMASSPRGASSGGGDVTPTRPNPGPFTGGPMGGYRGRTTPGGRMSGSPLEAE